ncbi:Dyp-type peroxidase [Shewanella sp. NIFS-20-20]|uniref:Dyp-type peroxidase n=1 Tax=Shewanella sp. NIFS-20-20 TaxID=2853806 RepID=UPI001C44387B|nr:Dyp-type peroxidase [Shewanella sp. NIFS-20-20]MBV7317211.1 Dyp-type peroxidase [Shewanella sp. NIFS-20-20]
MTHLSKLAQAGVLTNPTTHAEYMTFVINPSNQGVACTNIGIALAKLDVITKSINQKDLDASLSISIGFSALAWPLLFPQIPMPAQLQAFTPMQDGPRVFPATEGDIFVMIKSNRMDLNFQAAKLVMRDLASFTTLIEDIQGYKYLDNRDMIDFVDGTENPTGDERVEAVLVQEDIDLHQGGSYLTVQRYVDHLDKWEAQHTEYQEQVIGRTKMDNVELDDDVKPAWAHNAKSKVEIDDVEIKMLRQNRPWGNAKEHGTFFLGFASTPEIINTSLKQMIYADAQGDYDRLLDFVDAKTGGIYFMPSMTFLAQFDD